MAPSILSDGHSGWSAAARLLGFIGMSSCDPFPVIMPIAAVIWATPQDIAEFLLYDDEFPRAVRLCINRVTSSLRDPARRHGSDRGAPAEFARRQIEAMLEAGPGKSLTSRTLQTYLDRIQSALAHMLGEIG